MPIEVIRYACSGCEEEYLEVEEIKYCKRCACDICPVCGVKGYCADCYDIVKDAEINETKREILEVIKRKFPEIGKDHTYIYRIYGAIDSIFNLFEKPLDKA